MLLSVYFYVICEGNQQYLLNGSNLSSVSVLKRRKQKLEIIQVRNCTKQEEHTTNHYFIHFCTVNDLISVSLWRFGQK